MKTMNRTIQFFNYEQCFAHYTNKILCIRQAKIKGEVTWLLSKPKVREIDITSKLL